MIKNIYQNQPTEYQPNFKSEMIRSNFKTVYYVLLVLVPVAVFMLFMSVMIHDKTNIIIANSFLLITSFCLLMGHKRIQKNDFGYSLKSAKIVTHLTYTVILLWGMHMVGYNPDQVIFVMDMVLSIYTLAFLFMTTYQVLTLYYGFSLIYLMFFTPYSEGLLTDLPKLMSPILIMISAFFISRMLYLQMMERFVMSEKLKESHMGLTSELFRTLEKLRMTEKSMSDDIIRTLVKVLEYHDSYTRGHSENVADFAAQIARQMAFSQEQIDELIVCGLVHDIGKILIPSDLLNKTSVLTAEEYQTIKQHSRFGYNMLIEAKYLKRIAKIVLHHHERWDGKGYPDGLKADEIPLESQILVVADAWDAMTSERIYKKAKTVDAALHEMKLLKGSQFSPSVVDVLDEVIRKSK